MSALDKLRQMRNGADEQAMHRENYKKFIARFSEDEAKEYAESIRILFGKDDAAALALFEEGAYQTADQARESARSCWAVSAKEFY